MEYKDLLKLESLSGIEETGQMEVLGELFDLSFDQDNLTGLEHAFALAEQLDHSTLEPVTLTTLYYFLSNGWSYYRKIKYEQSQQSWSFQMEELTHEILYLRKAIASLGFSEVGKQVQCQIYTNLGNSFSCIGRFVEAQEYWHKAAEIIPGFSMAIGNMANGLFHYGRALFDPMHKNLFMVYAFHHLSEALKKKNIHIDARNGFQEIHDQLKNFITRNFPKEYLMGFPDLDNYDLGPDQELRDYRLWCLKNRLFVNPLNDLGKFSIASHDCLNLPTVTLPSDRPPVCLNLFNQIKQEFATARYCYYVSTFNAKPHFSDMDAPLVETMENIQYSYYTEQLKVSFRLAYSILDKVAYLLNDYLDLKIENSKVSFRGLWYTPKKQLRAFFETSDNWALRGLFWLSKDLYEKEMDFDLVLEPDAQEVSVIRNFIEHKGFKVLSDFNNGLDFFKEPDISYSITRGEFNKKTLKLMKIARAAVMYTAIAVSHEESKKSFDEAKKFSVQPGTVSDYLRN